MTSPSLTADQVADVIANTDRLIDVQASSEGVVIVVREHVSTVKRYTVDVKTWGYGLIQLALRGVASPYIW